MIDQLLKLDQYLFLFLNGCHTQWLDPLMLIITNKFTWIPFYIFLGYLIFKRNSSKAFLLFVALTIIGVGMNDLLSVHAFKNVFERLRPCHQTELDGMIHLLKSCGGKFGFVSNHASNSFFLAVVLGTALRSSKWIVGLLVWAALVAYSRIYVGVHFPLDILVGGIVGAGIGVFINFTIQKSSDKFKLT